MIKTAVSYSTIASDALPPLLAELYELGDLLNCRFLCNGLNDTYLVETIDQKYIYRIYKWNRRSSDDISFELELLSYLHINEIPVSYVIPRKDGQLLTELDAPEGLRYGALFTYAEGSSKHTDENCRLYGEEAARMHGAMDSFQSLHPRFKLDLEHLLTIPVQTIKPYLAHRSMDFEELVICAARLAERVNGLSPGLSWGVCHGDLHGWNVHFSDEGLTHFDFDCCGYGWRSYDVSVFLWARVRGKEKEEFTNGHWDSFLGGYQEISPLSEQELQAIPYFVAIREIWLMGLHTSFWPIWGANHTDSYFDPNLAFLRSWCEMHKIG